MANEKLIIKDPIVTIAGTDLSVYCKELTLTIEKKPVDVSAFGDGADRFQKGVAGHKVAMHIMHARAMSAVWGVLVPEYQSDNSTAVTVKFKTGSTGPDNILYTFNIVLNTLPVGGARGAVADMSLTFNVDGTVDAYDGTTHLTL